MSLLFADYAFIIYVSRSSRRRCTSRCCRSSAGWRNKTSRSQSSLGTITYEYKIPFYLVNYSSFSLCSPEEDPLEILPTCHRSVTVSNNVENAEENRDFVELDKFFDVAEPEEEEDENSEANTRSPNHLLPTRQVDGRPVAP